MTICPIALGIGCEKCPAFKFCPLTYVLGDQQEEESFPTAEEEVVSEKKKPLTKDERLALIKESAEKKSAYDQEVISDVNYERAKKNKLERDLKTWKRLDTYNK